MLQAFLFVIIYKGYVNADVFSVLACNVYLFRFHVRLIIGCGSKRCIAILDRSGPNYTMGHCGV